VKCRTGNGCARERKRCQENVVIQRILLPDLAGMIPVRRTLSAFPADRRFAGWL